MLLRVEHWVADPLVPTGDIGRSYYVLTDAIPARLDASATTRDSFRQDVAALLSADLLRLTIQPSLPSLSDYEFLGYQCRSVVVATERLDRAPIPPGRPRQQPSICFIDARPLLRGVQWRFVHNGRIAVDALLVEYAVDMPVGFRLNIWRSHRTPVGLDCASSLARAGDYPAPSAR